MKFILKQIFIVSLIILQISCNQNKENNQNINHQKELIPLVEKVLTANEHAALTPDSVLQILVDGNFRFMNNTLTARDHSAQVRNSVLNQFPKAIILSCIDSRVPVEDIFDRGIGDIFVSRVAGNIVNEDILGSMEYSCKIAGAKIVMVLGHQNCGAIKAAIADYKLGNITNLLAKIKPAISHVPYFKGERHANNQKFLHQVCVANVKHAVNLIREKSPILLAMEEKNQIKIVGAIYNMTTGEAAIIEEENLYED